MSSLKTALNNSPKWWDEDKWDKVEDHLPLHKLKSKYWGKRIEDDSRQWRQSHAVDDDDTNDIGPECYVLDTDLKIPCPIMWVRRDYARIYEYCERLHEKGQTSRSTPSVVITGQLGVGKTYWVTYAVRRRLGEQLPFLWYLHGHCYLFVSDGVYRQDIASLELQSIAPFLWTFVDADGTTGVPEQLLGHYKNLFITFTTSPKSGRWKSLSKNTAPLVIIMNTWSQEEIRQAAQISGLTDAEKNSAQANFEQLGPTPRLCFDHAQYPDALLDYVDRQRTMINRLEPLSFEKFIMEGGNLDLDGQSHLIFTVKRLNVHDLRRAYIAPTTANVEMEIMATIKLWEDLDRIKLYHKFASVDRTRVMAGILYEILGHLGVEGGITLTLKPMTKALARTRFHWKVQGGQQASTSMNVNTEMNVDTEMNVATETSMVIPANTAFIYEDIQGLRSVGPNRLYVPSARNQPGFDSFCVLDEVLYLLQFTISDEHDVKSSMEGHLDKLMAIPGLPPKANWRFVFVTPTVCDVDVVATPAVEVFMRGVQLYSAHLNVRQPHFHPPQ